MIVFFMIKLVVATRCEMIHWLNKVIEYSIRECSLNGKDNDLSYYLIHFAPFCHYNKNGFIERLTYVVMGKKNITLTLYQHFY